MNTREVVARCNEWANWRIRLQSTKLGYPSSTVEARINMGGKRPPGPIVPNLLMNPRAAEVDRAYVSMPMGLAEWVWLKHIEPGNEADKIKTWCRTNDCGRSKYYATQDRAYGFIAGWLTRKSE